MSKHSRREFLMQSGAMSSALVLPGFVDCKPHRVRGNVPRGPRIDTHQHFWTYTVENYSWIDPTSVVARDFGPADLEPELAAGGIDGTVAVEARGQIDETEDLLHIARQTPFVRGVVGWLPLIDPGIDALVEQYASDPKLRGLRHAIVAEADLDFMFRADFNHGIGLLQAHGLRYDLLLGPQNLSRAPAFVDRHPDQIFILDHFAKPYIRDRLIEPWRTDLLELALRPNVYCKVSGLVNEADLQNWQPSDLQPYLDTALGAFDPERLMFGSDWPMCLLATSYGEWLGTAQAWLAALSPDEQDRILGGTAIEAYGL